MAKRPGLGLTLPVRRGIPGFFNQGYDAITQIKSNLANLILTRKGERVMQPLFGCDIHHVMFDNITEDVISNAKGSIQEAIQTWMPFISVEDIQIQKDADNENKMVVQITFKLKNGLNITDTVTVVI